MFFIFIFLFLLLAVVWIIIDALRLGISPMPTSFKVKKCLLKVLEKNIQKKEKIFELGSGWGGLSHSIANRFSNSKVVGFEASFIPWFFSSCRYGFLKNCTFLWKNFYSVPLSEATVVVCYLYSGAMKKLKKKFENELEPGTIVITHTFRIPGWQPCEEISVDDIYHTTIYVYQVPSK